MDIVNGLTDDGLRVQIEKLGIASTGELREALGRALSLTATYLTYIAAVWVELERRGEDLSTLKTGIGKYVAAIGAGTLLAETVVAFSGQPVLLSRAAKLPVVEQRRAIEEPALIPTPAPRSKFRGPNRYETGARSTEAAPRPTLAFLLDMVKNCTAGDAADLCAKMIRGCADPAEVARRLLPEVERITKEKSRRAEPGST